ncbi:unnamed protein product [Albugo candida]|nr:unnamed protein product [Albugo candida]|eukprot:CCI48475.1 unnamed protein product [Albugo candida]
MTSRILNRVAQIGSAVGLGGFAVQECLYDVDGGHRAVIFDRRTGILPKSVGEGTHAKIPFIQYPTILDVRSTYRVISSRTGTKDLQMVNISLRVLSRPDVLRLPHIFAEYGADYSDRILPSVGNEVLKSVVAQYDASELLTFRDKVSHQISQELKERAGRFALSLDDVSITHLEYGPEFTRAVEQKQVAQQEAERQKFVVMRSEQERQAAIIRAEGESEAAKLVSEAVAKSGNGFIENPPKGVSNVQRRTWDRAHYAKLAELRANGTTSAETENDTKRVRSDRIEFQKAEKKSSSLIDQNTPALLKARESKLALENDIGKVQMLLSKADESETPQSSAAGYHCDVCECTLKDSVAYLDHVNGKKHLRRLGFSMRVERSSVEKVKLRLQNAIQSKWEPLLHRKRDLVVDENDESNIEKVEENKNKRHKKNEAEGAQEDEGKEEISIEEQEMREMMGFKGFSSSKK